LLGGSEAIVGIVVLVLVWLATRVLQKRNVGRQATALGMALGPVTILLGFVVGVVLVLHGTGLL
jgi:ABC-type transporter Mla maintaining outer membrane lipid asymmetry permease subunit MlaE